MQKRGRKMCIYVQTYVSIHIYTHTYLLKEKLEGCIKINANDYNGSKKREGQGGQRQN